MELQTHSVTLFVFTFCSIRAQFGTDVKSNAVHGASTEEDAKAVIEQLFGKVVIDEDGHLDMGKSH